MRSTVTWRSMGRPTSERKFGSCQVTSARLSTCTTKSGTAAAAKWREAGRSLRAGRYAKSAVAAELGEKQSSTHCLLHERADPCLVGGSQLLQREGGRPHLAFVKGRLVAEAERCVPRLELLRALEEADDAVVPADLGES